MSIGTKQSHPQMNPKINTLLSGFEASQSTYSQGSCLCFSLCLIITIDLANIQNKYFSKTLGFSDSVSKTAEYRHSVENSRYPVDHHENLR